MLVRRSHGRRLRPTSDRSSADPYRQALIRRHSPSGAVNGAAERRNFPGERVINRQCQEIRLRIGKVGYLVVTPRVGASAHVANIDDLRFLTSVAYAHRSLASTPGRQLDDAS
jgi:hypothetical protein